MFAEEHDEVADCRDACVAVSVSGDFGEFDHVMQEAFEVADRAGKIDGGVHLADDRFVCVDHFSYCFGEVVWSTVTEDIDNLFAVTDGKLYREILQCMRVVGLCQAPFEFGIL